jgi:hypothetical protein
MTEKTDALMDEVRAALDVTPSSSFEVRVRQRTAGERIDRIGWRWAGAALIAGAAAAVALAAVAARPDVAVPPASTAGARTAAANAPLAASVNAPVPTRAAAAAETTPAGTSRLTPKVPAPRPVRADEPVVLISPDQAVAVEQLLASVWARRTVYPADRQRFDPESGDLLPPESIEVAPIAMAALSYDTPNEVNR